MRFFSTLFKQEPAESADPYTLDAAEYAARFVLTNVPHKLVDVRSPAEFAAGYVTGAQNIPLPEVSEQMSRIPRDMPVMLYCRSGNRSGQAMHQLQMAGYTNVYNIGGLSGLAAQGLPIEKND
ncbi:MAG: rhodanese-like domain-containing protein [Caldilineaceae bacterium]|nr:rhodanese-like domain-containing protein [Caldilineaceae bacterium]